jgi:hypothetical protein
LLRDSIEARFGNRLAEINRGVEKDGAFYLFTLRLIPLVPFFVINLVMGLTQMRAWTFYWVSQLGMLAGTAVFVNAGTQLARIDSLKGILSPGLLGSFVLLGVFPLAGAQGGGGNAKAQGLCALARRAAQHVRPQPDCHRRRCGRAGVGLHRRRRESQGNADRGTKWGRLSQLRLRAQQGAYQVARVAHTLRHADHYGLEAGEPTFSFRTVMARVHRVIADIAPHDSVERYTALGVEVLQGYATVVDPWTVEIQLNDGGTQGSPPAASLRPAPAPLCPRCRAWKKSAMSPATPSGMPSPRWTPRPPPRGAGRWAHRLRAGAELCPAGLGRHADRDGAALAREDEKSRSTPVTPGARRGAGADGSQGFAL